MIILPRSRRPGSPRRCALAFALLVLDVTGALPLPALGAQESPATTSEDEAELSRVLVHGYAQAAFLFNPDFPRDRVDFGRLFDDRPNEPRLHSLSLILERPSDEADADVDFGMKFHLAVGSDLRYTHGLGLLDEVTNTSLHPDVVESWIAVRAPLGTASALELKLGSFASLCGLESMDPTANWLYSRTYIFNFGVPFRHAGILATLTASSWLSVSAGVVSGINTAMTDNNDALSFHGGASATLFGGDLSVSLGVLHGPENDTVTGRLPGVDPNHDSRTILDLVVKVRLAEKLTLAWDLNLGFDRAPLGADHETPEWYGVAGYLVYQANEVVTLVLRGEVFRDDDAFAVVQYAANDDAMDVLRGSLSGLDPRTVGGGATTYLAATLGANFQVTQDLLLQGEFRADHATSSTPFDAGSRDRQFTFAVSALLRF